MSRIFKVFRRLPGSSGLFSLTEAKGARLAYEVGKETKPNSGEGALFAFESYEAARAFQVCGDEIWECHATNVRPLGWRVVHENLGRIRRGFWRILSPEEYSSD